MFFVLKFKKILIIFLLISTILTSYFIVNAKETYIPNIKKTILIDAGHGGIDGGAEGINTGVSESFLNLQYTKRLKELFEEYGYRVVLTRADMNGLYSPFAENKKKSEMEKRKSIIEKTNPDLVLSIHMNSFSSKNVKGAQVFYKEKDGIGKMLAEEIQNSLYKNVKNVKKDVKSGDFFILNCNSSLGVLIECGYLSNPEEEKLLQDKDYMNNFCYFILCGVINFFS